MKKNQAIHSHRGGAVTRWRPAKIREIANTGRGRRKEARCRKLRQRRGSDKTIGVKGEREGGCDKGGERKGSKREERRGW